MKNLKVVMLDIESVGLKGDIVSIQVSYQYMKKEHLFIIPDDEKRPEYLQFLSDLDNENLCFIGFNIAFDLWKLYGHLKRKTPFKCQTMDLMFHLKDSKTLAGILTAGKSLLQFKAIPEEILEELKKELTILIKETIPSNVVLKVHESSFSKVLFEKNKKKKSTKFHDLIFETDMNRRLKTVCSILFRGKKIYSSQDALMLKDYKEDKEHFFITEKEKPAHDAQKEKLLSKLRDKNSNTFKYSIDDVRLLWELKKWIEIDSNHTLIMNINDCCSNIIAFTKYIGFSIDLEKALKLQDKFQNRLLEIKKLLPIKNINSSKQRRDLLLVNSNIIFAGVIDSVDKENIVKYIQFDGLLTERGLEYANLMLEIGQCSQRLRQIKNMIEKYNSKRVYPDLSIEGTVTNRMSGRGGLNFQGIPRDGEIRELIKTSFGGDFSSLEITLAHGAIGAFNDQLRAYEEGKALDTHTHTARNVFTEEWAEIFGSEDNIQVLIKQVNELKNNKKDNNYKKFKELRGKGKQANFMMLYGGTTRLGKEVAEKFYKTYPEIQIFHKKIQDAFITLCPEDQEPNWTIEAIKSMCDGVCNIFGSKRYICFEKEICVKIMEKSNKIAENIQLTLPEETYIKRNKENPQTVNGIVKSILCGSLTNLQNTLCRQSINYPIQASGAELCKRLMVYVFNTHRIPMLNIHDEIIVPEEYAEKYEEVNKTIQEFIKANKSHTRYLDMELDKMKTWADKK